MASIIAFQQRIRRAEDELTYVHERDCKLSNFCELSTLDGHTFGFVLEERVVDDAPAYQVSIFAESPTEFPASIKGKTFANFITKLTGVRAVSEIRIPLGYTDTSFRTLCKHETDTLKEVATLLEKLCSSEMCDCGREMIPSDVTHCNNCLVGMPDNGGQPLKPTERGVRYMLNTMVRTIDFDGDRAFSNPIRLRTKSGYRFELCIMQKEENTFSCVLRSSAERVILVSARGKTRQTSKYCVFFRLMDENFVGKSSRKDAIPEIVRVLTRIVKL